jgi:hypothetical protein
MNRRELLSLLPVAGATFKIAKGAAPPFERFDCHVHLHEHCRPSSAD